jgi:hypothetical protein
LTPFEVNKLESVLNILLFQWFSLSISDGYEVEAAGSGIQGLALTDTVEPPFSNLILSLLKIDYRPRYQFLLLLAVDGFVSKYLSIANAKILAAAIYNTTSFHCSFSSSCSNPTLLDLTLRARSTLPEMISPAYFLFLDTCL